MAQTSNLQSMTGYGRATRRTAAGTITVELRSTNHRYLEIEHRLSNGLNIFHGRVNELIRASVKRGRIEATVSVQAHLEDSRRVVLDETLLARYHEALLEMKQRFGLKGPVALEHLLALPHAVTIVEERMPLERLWPSVRQATIAALKELVKARRREGTKLLFDLRRQVVLIEQHRRAIINRLPKALEQQRQRLREQLNALLGSKSAGSASVLEQALSLVKDADIHEELVRLESHLGYMRQTLAQKQPVGKRMDFIAQELMREANTTGAKVDDPQATQQVVEIKQAIEKIREQVQNLE